MNSSNPFKNLKADIPASIAVFFVALLLCLGIALARAAPLFLELIAGISRGHCSKRVQWVASWSQWAGCRIGSN